MTKRVPPGKIAILGASVSDQTVHHTTGAVTGYAELLRRDHTEDLGSPEIRQITYPGNRLSDGGLLRLGDVLAWQPDICLLEPLIEDSNRGQNSREAEKRYVYIALLEAGILPVTLLLPEPFGRPARELPHHDQFVNISKQYGLPVIEIDLDGVADLGQKFQQVHTLLEGARIYAKQIVAGLKSLTDPKLLVRASLERARELGHPLLTVTPLPGPKTIPPSVTSLNIALANDDTGPLRIRLVQKQKIGTFSPVLDLSLKLSDGTLIRTDQISVWDEYCHYTRESFVVLADMTLNRPGQHELSMAVSNSLPDYAVCRRKVNDWPAFRHMEPLAWPTLIADRPLAVRITQCNGIMVSDTD